MSKNGVYPIPPLSTLSASPVSSTGFVAVSDQVLLWDKRLGHPCSKILHSALSDFKSVYVPINNDICSQCPACIRAKMHKISVPKQVSYSTFPLELIHSDAWGLAPIVSELGHKLYVIFVDNFTRFTWMFLLRHKSDVFNVFVHFKSLVKIQFNSTIKILRSDRGGEYDNHKFKSFCLDHGIQHQFSCPYTPQQNGVAERKHRHVVENGRAMLHQSQLPLSFWSYAFSTAIFLINRILSSVLNFVSPWEKFFHKKPPLQALKAFGCACYPLLRSYPSHKLQPKSSQCIFLGYLPMLKGYICLDTTSGRIYISSQAIFHESVFPSYSSV